MATHEKMNVLEIFPKYIDNPNFPQWLVDHPEIAHKLAQNKYINRAIEYMVEAGYHKYEDLLAAFEKTSQKLSQTMLTTKQQLEREIERQVRKTVLQEGMEQGMQQGMEQGMQTKSLEIAKNMLFQLHLGMDVVQKATGLNKEELAQLANQAH